MSSDKPQRGLQMLYAAFLILAIVNLSATLSDRQRDKRGYTCKQCGHKQKK